MGGTLLAPKCSLSLVVSTGLHEHEISILRSPAIFQMSNTNGQIIPIHCCNPNEAFVAVGMYLALSRNMKPQVGHLQSPIPGLKQS